MPTNLGLLKKENRLSVYDLEEAKNKLKSVYCSHLKGVDLIKTFSKRFGNWNEMAPDVSSCSMRMSASILSSI